MVSGGRRPDGFHRPCYAGLGLGFETGRHGIEAVINWRCGPSEDFPAESPLHPKSSTPDGSASRPRLILTVSKFTVRYGCGA